MTETPKAPLRAALVALLLVAGVTLGLSTVRAEGAVAPRTTSAQNGQIVLNVGGSLAGVTTPPFTLSPTFAPTITDYAIWCTSTGGNRLTLTLSGTNLTYGTQSGSTLQIPVTPQPNQAIVIDANGQPGGYWIRCLPPGFPQLSVTMGSTSPTPGYYLTGTIVGGEYAMVLNQNGTPVWYQQAPNGAINVTQLPNSQTLAWSPTFGNSISSDPIGAYRTFNLSTGATGVIRGPLTTTDFHELQMPNGNYLMLTSPLLSGVSLQNSPVASLRSYTTIIDCVVEEFTPSGSLVWSWDAWKDGHIYADEDADGVPLDYNGQAPVDLYHCNSLDMSPGGKNVLVSSRHMDALFDVSVATKQVLWKFDGNSATPTYAGQSVPHIVATGDPEGGISGQHDARIMSVNPADDQPTEISVFDDHSFTDDGSFGVKSGGAGDGARGVEYSIDSAAGTAALTAQFEHPQTSGATGSFRVYNTNGVVNNLVCWGLQGDHFGFTEYDQSGNLLMNLNFPGGEEVYRVTKAPATGPGALDLTAMRATAGLPPPAPPNPYLHLVPNGILTSGPALTSWTSTRYDIFGRGGDGALWHAWWTGSGWSGWQSLGGQIEPGTQPAAVAWGPNRIDVFIEGVDQQLWHIWWGGSSWSGWEPHGGILTGSPAVASWAPNRLDVVMPGGGGGGIWTQSWNGSGWSGFSFLGGATHTTPALTAWGPNRLDLFVQGTDGSVDHQWYANGWAGIWETLGGGPTTGPAAASVEPGELDILVGGSGSVAEHLQYTGAWQPWYTLTNEGAATQAPALVSLLDGNDLEMCVTGSGGFPWCGSLAADQEIPLIG